VTNPLITVEDGHLAVAYLGYSLDHLGEQPRPGVLFLDLKMPNSDGFDVLRWIQNRSGARQGMLVIVMSGIDNVADVQCAYDLGADTFLSKPFTPTGMLHLIQTFPGYWARTTPAPNLTPWQHLDSEAVASP
jgi:DNA-binding response OmpR family regulator